MDHVTSQVRGESADSHGDAQGRGNGLAKADSSRCRVRRQRRSDHVYILCRCLSACKGRRGVPNPPNTRACVALGVPVLPCLRPRRASASNYACYCFRRKGGMVSPPLLTPKKGVSSAVLSSRRNRGGVCLFSTPAGGRYSAVLSSRRNRGGVCLFATPAGGVSI
jgi:hypothetical protein